MIEGEESSRTYKLNRHTKVKIKSKKIEGAIEDIYTHKIIVEHEQTTISPLMFQNKSQITKLIEDIDFDEDQTNMFSKE